MSTIQDLKNANNVNIRAKTLPGSITTDMDADLRDMYADELNLRGVKVVDNTVQLSALSYLDFRIAVVRGNGIFTDSLTGPANGDSIFAGQGGHFWVRILDVTLPELPEGVDPTAASTTITTLRAMESTSPDLTALAKKVFFTTETGKEGRWFYDASDTTSADNGATVLVSGALRFKRIYTEIMATWWGVVANGTTDDTTALQAASDFAANQGKGVILRLPRGRIRITATWNIGYTADSSLSYGMIIQGAGRAYAPYNNAKGGTTIWWDGPSGAGTKVINIRTGTFRYWRWQDFSIAVQSNDAVETGINFENAASSTFKFADITVGDYGNAPTYGVRLNSNGANNAEFNYFERMSFCGTLNAFYQDSFQSLSHMFISCSGLCGYGGTLLNFVAAAGGTFLGCNLSGAVGFQDRANSTVYTKGDYARSNGNMYRVKTAGTSGVGTAPSGTSLNQGDGTVVWDYVRAAVPSTLIAVGGTQPDTIVMNGGRNEGMGKLLHMYDNAGNMTLNITGVTTSIPELSQINMKDWITCANNAGASLLLNITSCTWYTVGLTEGALPSLMLLPINFVKTPMVQINFYDNSFNDCMPFVRSIGTSDVNFASNTSGDVLTGQLRIIQVGLRKCRLNYTTNTGSKLVDIDKDLANSQTYTNHRLKPENLLLQSRYGSATGATITAPAPWVHVGVAAFDRLDNMNTGDNNEVNAYGVRMRMLTGSTIYQDITAIDITTASAKIVRYKAVIAASKNTQFSISFENSLTGLKYDQFAMTTSSEALGTNRYHTHIIDLMAIIPSGQTGALRLVQANLGAGVLWVEMYEQHVFTSFNACFTPTTTTIVSKLNEWVVYGRSVKALNRMQIPFLDDTFGSSITGANAELEADLYTSRTDLKVKHYTDRWEVIPRSDAGTAIPATGTFPIGFIRYNTAATGPAGWRCVAAGTPGTWVEFGPITETGQTNPVATPMSGINGAVTSVYMLHSRQGNMVSFSFYFNITPLTIGTDMVVRLTPPIPSNFILQTDVIGTAEALGTGRGTVFASDTSDTIVVQVEVASVSSTLVRGTGMYIIK